MVTMVYCYSTHDCNCRPGFDLSKKQWGSFPSPYLPFPSPSLSAPFQPPRQKFSVTSVGVIFNQWGGLNPQPPPPTNRTLLSSCFQSCLLLLVLSLYKVLIDLETSLLVCRQTFRVWRSNSYVKVVQSQTTGYTSVTKYSCSWVV